MSKIEQIEPKNWAKFLDEFSARNKNRRARFQIFKGRTAEEETRELHFESAQLNKDGDSSEVVVTRTDHTRTDENKTRETITNVKGISIQFDTDGSEAVLQITDRENELISLRFESKVDGAS